MLMLYFTSYSYICCFNTGVCGSVLYNAESSIIPALWDLCKRYIYTTKSSTLPSEKLLLSLTSNGFTIILSVSLGNYMHNAGLNSSLSPGREHDAQEFLTFLLDDIMCRMTPE